MSLYYCTSVMPDWILAKLFSSTKKKFHKQGKKKNKIIVNKGF